MYGDHGRAKGTRVRMRGGLPLKGAFRLRRFGDIWHKNALSAVIALAIPDLSSSRWAVWTWRSTPQPGRCAPCTRTACRTRLGRAPCSGWRWA